MSQLDRFTLTRAGLIVALLVSASGPVLATTILKADIPTLRNMSQSVVQARVADMRAVAGDRGMIFTEVTLNVIRNLHGEQSQQLVVRVPGLFSN